MQLRYPTIDKNHFIAGGWTGIPGLTSQDVLDAVTVSMGTIGVIYSVVLKVVPQFAVHQVVHPTNWKQLLADAPATEKLLLDGDVASNQNVLNLLLDGTHNGTGIMNNSFAHLRINPFNGDCWLINQERPLLPDGTPQLPDDENNPSVDFLTPLSQALSSRVGGNTVRGNKVAGRLFDFLSWATDDADIAFNDVAQGMRLLNFITAQGDLFGGTLAPLTAQAIANVINHYSNQDRGQQFLADLVSGLFHGLHGTGPGQNSDITGVPYKFAAIGWPARGIPGRAIEVVLDYRNAFTFLQTLFQDVFDPNMSELSHDLKPLIGYIAVRVCQRTRTLMGMQQYDPFSVTIEVAGYRSPEADIVMDLIQKTALSFSTAGLPKPLLHWGLENDQVTGAYLAGTPLGEKFNGGPFTRLEAFTKIRNFLGGGGSVFNNWFADRLGL